MILLRILPYLIIPLGFGFLSLHLGQDANWDLRNYHYYNAHAFLTGRLNWDILAAQKASFYNPLLDVPFYFAAHMWKAQYVGFGLGVLHGLNFILLFFLSRRLLPGVDDWRRALLVLAGVMGGGALGELGTTLYDNVLSLGIVGSLLLITRFYPDGFEQGIFKGLMLALLAGIPAGMAFGFKLPHAIFPTAMCLAILLLPLSFGRRILTAFGFGLGVLLGLALTGGFWMYYLWESFGNPFLPYFNQYFKSSWALPDAYRDTQFMPKNLVERIFFPVFFALDTLKVGEAEFRDFGIPASFVLMPLALVLFRRLAGLQRFILGFTVIAYVLWVVMFCIYRYLVPLEMLAPIIIAVIFGAISRPYLRTLVPILALALLGSSVKADWIRIPWGEYFIETVAPPILSPDNTLVLMAGQEPSSFLIPAFPHKLRFLRIDSNFTNPLEHENGFNPYMRKIVAEHKGPLMVLYFPKQKRDVMEKLYQYNLKLGGNCSQVRSNIAPSEFLYCNVLPK